MSTAGERTGSRHFYEGVINDKFHLYRRLKIGI